MHSTPISGFVALFLAVCIQFGCAPAGEGPAADDAALLGAETNAGEWLMINNGYSEQRYSQLNA